MRQSRAQCIVKGSLRGLSAREYYNIHQISEFNAARAARKYLPENLWTKFNRRKCLTKRQADTVADALNEAVMELASNYPMETPAIRLLLKVPPMSKDPGKGKMLIVEGIGIVRLPKASTPNGTVYFSSEAKLEYDGKKGLVGFSSHALERFIERVNVVREYAYKCDSLVTIRILNADIIRGKVSMGSDAPQLTIGPESRPFGYFPIKWIGDIWVCTTFLDPKMQGTPGKEKERYDAAMEELIEKFG